MDSHLKQLTFERGRVTRARKRRRRGTGRQLSPSPSPGTTNPAMQRASSEPVVLINHSGSADWGPELYTVPWKSTPFCHKATPTTCRQYRIMLDDAEVSPLCQHLGIDESDRASICEWLELGQQGLGVQDAIKQKGSGVTVCVDNVVLVLHVAAKKVEYCLQ